MAKTATAKLQRASVQHRTDIARLKKQIGQQDKEIGNLRKQLQQPHAPPEVVPEVVGVDVRRQHGGDRYPEPDCRPACLIAVLERLN